MSASRPQGAAAGTVRVFGAEVATHYGDPSAEYAAARSAVALCEQGWRAVFRATGPARIEFLQKIVSNDVASCPVGEGVRVLLLDTRGKVIADLDVWVEEDGVTLSCDLGAAESALATLRKYVLASPVRFEQRFAPQEERDVEVVVGVLGPGAEDLLEGLGAELPQSRPRGLVRTRIADAPVAVARAPRLATAGVELHVPEEHAAAVCERLAGAGGDAPPRRTGWVTAEVLRVEAGWPRQGAELTGEEFPQEARLDDAVDFEKGCYLGQETVARIHYRGHVNRYLCGFRLLGPAAEGVVDAIGPLRTEVAELPRLVADGRDVGELRSAALSPAVGPLALGYARREHADPGVEMEVQWADGGCRARVEALPFDIDTGADS